jgi:hypothetical protein
MPFVGLVAPRQEARQAQMADGRHHPQTDRRLLQQTEVLRDHPRRVGLLRERSQRRRKSLSRFSAEDLRPRRSEGPFTALFAGCRTREMENEVLGVNDLKANSSGLSQTGRWSANRRLRPSPTPPPGRSPGMVDPSLTG